MFSSRRLTRWDQWERYWKTPIVRKFAEVVSTSRANSRHLESRFRFNWKGGCKGRPIWITNIWTLQSSQFCRIFHSFSYWGKNVNLKYLTIMCWRNVIFRHNFVVLYYNHYWIVTMEPLLYIRAGQRDAVNLRSSIRNKCIFQYIDINICPDLIRSVKHCIWIIVKKTLI
jgi:hypothetical protein